MLLSEVLNAASGRGLGADHCVVGDPGTEIRSVAHDSRQVGPGTLFCCVPGLVHDGHDYADAAAAAGAAALLCERRLEVDLPQVLVPSVRRAMGPVAAAVAGFPADQLDVVAITGTNGKTTTAELLAAILEADGRSCGIIGTLTGARTTPEAPELQAQLADLLAQGRQAVAMEVSSHALDAHRIDGTRVRVAVFTNLSQDHLDHHGTMEAYFAAKARLFTTELSDQAVLNRDDVHGRLLADTVTIGHVTYGLDDAEDLDLGAHRSRFRWRGQDVELALPGRFNVSNALAAATAAAQLGVAPEAVAQGLRHAGVVDGRFERVDEGQQFLAVVDYAHTPDGLRKLLETARELVAGRVIVVFGAGGDRDPTKRGPMGAAAAELADVVVLTTDNPRSEDPAAIMAAVERGMDHPTDLRIEPDRRAAIDLAVAEARPGDAVLVAGKGHERTQIVGEVVTPFDDRAELRAALRAQAGSAR